MTQLDLFSADTRPKKAANQVVPDKEIQKTEVKEDTALAGNEKVETGGQEKGEGKRTDAYPVTFNPPVVEQASEVEAGKGDIVFENRNISVKIKSRQPADGNAVPKKPEPRRSIVTGQPKSEFSIALNEKLSQVKNNIKEGLLKDVNAEKKKKQREAKIPQKRGRKSFKEIDDEADLIEIPDDDILFKKQYYSISEVAGWFKVNTSLLRFWENEFDILKPRKNRKGDRLFRPEDVKNLQLIYQLLRQRKFSIEGAKEFIKSNKNKADTQMLLVNTLQKFRSFLLELKANL